MGRHRKPNLVKGTWVDERAKPKRHGKLLRGDRKDGNKHTWVVEFEQADGTKSEEVKTSAQLSRSDLQGPTPTGATNTSDNEEQHGNPPEASDDENKSDSDTDSENNEIETPPRPKRRAALNHRVINTPKPTAGISTSLTESSSGSESGNESDDDSGRGSSDSDSDSDDLLVVVATNHIDGNPAYDWTMHIVEGEEEQASNDGFPFQDDDSVTDSAGSSQEPTNVSSPNEPTESIPNEPTEDLEAADERDFEREEEHRLKMDVYLAEKEVLLEEGWSVSIVPEKPPLQPGAVVHSRHKKPKKGKVIKRSPCGEHWLVQFNGSERLVQMSSHGLTQVWEAEPYVWKIVEDSEPDSEEMEDYDTIGLVGFDFTRFSEQKIEETIDTLAYEYPFMKLLQYMWPGNPKEQVVLMNKAIDVENEDRKKKKRQLVKPVTEHEYWKFIGVLISAAAFRLGGHQLWEKESGRLHWTVTDPIDLGCKGQGIMPFYRFKDLKSMFPSAFQDMDAKEKKDPWSMVRGILNGYNDKRARVIAASIRKIMDESMSAYKPQTTKTGNIPHLSYIDRKPEPLGTELKTVACSKTGVIIYAEIQEGAIAMNKKRHAKLGGTISCSIRLAEDSLYCGSKLPSRQEAKARQAPECFKGDSWFTSVPVAEWMSEHGHAYSGAMKTNTRLFPNKEIEEKMEQWPSGSYLVLECHTPNGHDLIAIGYRYNRKKTLLFLATKNAGSTKPGRPYTAKFADSLGTIQERLVPRPAVLSEYFNDSNVIDTHNHVRQGELKLEKRWVTHDGWFRIATTIIGMTITDCWKLIKHSGPDYLKETTIVQFADMLAADLIRNNVPDKPPTGNGLYINVDGPPAEIGGRPQEVCSPVTVATVETVVTEHKFADNSDCEDDGHGRPRRRVCQGKGCTKKTQKKCQHRSCKSRRYNANGPEKRGVFFCENHWGEHHKDVAAALATMYDSDW
ncbi:unknown protein [Seminavis robusta]|uniref:PiggyBac transposable element-derived protein domain-containing protein n=1 Tax=Seminavis robusta TaxID=568900 RepID=A0A9N8EZE2_9STRA|nr:unknown protein [Seminavis robusta]|eukprot:Sro2087_g313890.1 n/a (958) ;mRNA; r:12562-15435